MGSIEKDGFVWPPGLAEDRGDDGGIGDPGGDGGGVGGEAGGKSGGLRDRLRPSRVWSVRRIGRGGFAPRPRWVQSLEAAVFGAAREQAAWSVAAEAAFDEPACWRCAGPVGPGETDRAGCGWCRARRLGFERAVSLGRYDGSMRDAIHGLKYHADRSAGEGLGRAMGRAIGAVLSSQGISRTDVALVPVPAAFGRRMGRNRGVDHALTLARAASRECGCRVVRCLCRAAGPSQTEVAGSKRDANVRGVFSVRPEWDG